MVYTGNIQVDALLDTFKVEDLKKFIQIKESANKPEVMTWKEQYAEYCLKELYQRGTLIESK
ncbi:MAG: hypothetical protein PF444_00475 [Bacteroidales bacterium]|jgi:hypothetical protein|nr:hypothetical protein [Bacteroidales bacterium]